MGEENNFETTEVTEVTETDEVFDEPTVTEPTMDIAPYEEEYGGGGAKAALGIIGIIAALITGGVFWHKHKKAKKAAEDEQKWCRGRKYTEVKPKKEETEGDEIIDPE